MQPIRGKKLVTLDGAVYERTISFSRNVFPDTRLGTSDSYLMLKLAFQCGIRYTLQRSAKRTQRLPFM